MSEDLLRGHDTRGIRVNYSRCQDADTYAELSLTHTVS